MMVVCAIWTCASAARAVEPIDHALPQNHGIVSVSDSIPNTYNHVAGKLADGSDDTAWITGSRMTEHWAQIRWRVLFVDVQRIEIDFHPIATSVSPSKSFDDMRTLANETYTTVEPGTLRLEALVAGQWRTLHAFDQIVPKDGAWQFDAPLVNVSAVRLTLRSEGDELFAVRSFRVLGPTPATSLAMRPKWEAQWIWGDEQPLLANYGVIRRYFRRVFDIDDPSRVGSMAIQFVAHDRGRVYLNGELIAQTAQAGVGFHPMAAHQPIDPSLLRVGANVLAIVGEDLEEVGLRGICAKLSFVARGDAIKPIVTNNTWQVATSDEPGWKTQAEGFDHWPAAIPRSVPDQKWQSAWEYPYTPATFAGVARVTDVRVSPPTPRPHEPFELAVTVRIDEPLDGAYGMVVELGERTPAHIRGIDMSLGECFIMPADGLPQGFSGETTMRVRHIWPKGTPPRVGVTIRLCNPAGQLRIDGGREDGQLLVRLGEPTPAKQDVDFPVVDISDQGVLTIDGDVTAPILFTSSLATPDRFQTHLTSGIKLHRIMLGDHASVMVGIDEPAGQHERQIESLAAQVRVLRANDPDARVLIMAGLDMPNSWKFKHHEDAMILGDGRRLVPLSPRNHQIGYVQESPASRVVREAVYRQVRDFVKLVREQPWADAVIGFAFMQGRAGENIWGLNANMRQNTQGQWVVPDRHHYIIGDYSPSARRSFARFLHERYESDAEFAAAWQWDGLRIDDVMNAGVLSPQRILSDLMWHDRPADRFMFRDSIAEGNLYRDYVEHHEQGRAKLILEACRAVKEASDGRLLAGGYIGYILPSFTNSPPGMAQHSGHSSLELLTGSPYIDCMFSPHWYHLRRQGEPVMGMAVSGSLRLHGKLFVNEYDSRTYLSEIGPKTFSKTETLEVFQKEFANAITNNQAWWWYEFGMATVGAKAAPWFDDPDLLTQANTMKRVYDRYLSLPRTGPAAQIAVIVHAHQAYHTDPYAPANTVHSNLINILLPRFYSAGAPVDIYDMTDLDTLIERGWHKRYKLVVFMNAFHLDLDQRQRIEQLKTDGRTLLMFFAPGYQGNEGETSELSLAGIEQVTGMPGVRRIDEQHVIGFTASEPAMSFDAIGWWDPVQMTYYKQPIGPVFYLDPTGDRAWTSLATLRLDEIEHEDRVAIAELEADDHRVVYSTIPNLPIAMLNRIVRDAGVHQFAEPGILVWANDHMVAVHTGEARQGVVVSIPHAATWIEPFEGKVYARDTNHITVDLEFGETKFFCLDRDGLWSEFAR
jgi:hypothetical protein